MVEWLRYSTRIHKILCTNLSILVHEMILDRSLTANLSRMTNLYRASVSKLDRRGANTAACEKKKTIETGCMRILIIIATGPNER